MLNYYTLLLLLLLLLLLQQLYYYSHSAMVMQFLAMLWLKFIISSLPYMYAYLITYYVLLLLILLQCLSHGHAVLATPVNHTSASRHLCVAATYCICTTQYYTLPLLLPPSLKPCSHRHEYKYEFEPGFRFTNECFANKTTVFHFVIISLFTHL